MVTELISAMIECQGQDRHPGSVNQSGKQSLLICIMVRELPDTTAIFFVALMLPRSMDTQIMPKPSISTIP